jgi:hypothetical protein
MAHSTRALGALTPDDLRAFLGARDARKLAHNTWIERDGDDVAVRLHATRILTFHADGSFTVNSGGWRTVTTKQRLNALMPAGYRVFSERYAWKLSTPGGVYDFEDGDTWAVATCDCEGPLPWTALAALLRAKGTHAIDALAS